MGIFTFIFWGKTATLNHEATDDSMENRIGIKAFLHILQEIGHGLGGLVRIELQDDIALVGFKDDPWFIGRSPAGDTE